MEALGTGMLGMGVLYFGKGPEDDQEEGVCQWTPAPSRSSRVGASAQGRSIIPDGAYGGSCIVSIIDVCRCCDERHCGVI